LKKSHYFSDLHRSYSDEVDDLVTDSEGKSVLQKRLNDKRREIDAILPMIEFSPEMVAVVFYDAFRFKSQEVMQRIALSSPGRTEFLLWSELKKQLTIADWAEPLVKSTLKADGGDAFLVTTATLEYLRTKAAFFTPAPAPEDENERDDENDDKHDDEDPEDLSEAGGNWLSEQGFDPLER
jgi:hypothetical protein